MRSADTSPEADRVQIELIRQAGPQRRLQLALDLTRMVRAFTWQAIAAAHPGADEDELAVLFVAQCYGTELAEKLRADLARRRVKLQT